MLRLFIFFIYCSRTETYHQGWYIPGSIVRVRRSGGATTQNMNKIKKNTVRSWRIKLVWHGMLFCGLWSLVLLPPLSFSLLGQCIQWPSRLARCEPDWWTGRTASCGGGSHGQPSHPPWSGHSSHWPRSSQGHLSRRGFWPAGGWCTSHIESSAQRGEGEGDGEWDQRKRRLWMLCHLTTDYIYPSFKMLT